MSDRSSCELLAKGPAAPIEMVDHIFECIAALRGSLSTPTIGVVPDEARLAESVVAALTADVSKLFRETTCGPHPAVSCPAHGPLEVVKVGSKRHSEVLDVDFKVGGRSGIVCRYCQRESVLYDLKFNYCSKCKYVRCMFCVPRGVVYWRTLRRLLEANPASAGTVFPGSRLLLHEVVALVPPAADAAEQDALSVVRLVLATYSVGPRMPDSIGDLPLHWACCGQSAACVKLVIDAYPEGLTWTNQKGKLPLHIACRGGNVEIVKLLLDSLPSPSGLDRFSDNGNLPLHLAVSRHSIVPSIVMACLEKFPDAIRLQNKKTKQLALHLALSNRDNPDMKVVRSLLHAYPASALLPLGQEEELALHLVLSRPSPSIPALHALLDICPESALTASTETAWSSAETPIDLANRKAAAAFASVDRAKDPEIALEKRKQGELFLHAARIMLSRNRKQDPALLRHLNWEERKQAVFMIHCEKNRHEDNILFKLSCLGGIDIVKHVVSFV